MARIRYWLKVESTYPADLEQAHERIVSALAKRFCLRIGTGQVEITSIPHTRTGAYTQVLARLETLLDEAEPTWRHHFLLNPDTRRFVWDTKPGAHYADTAG